MYWYHVKQQCFGTMWNSNVLVPCETAMFWYHKKQQLLLNKMQLFSWYNKLLWKRKTHFILALVAHIWKKNSIGEPNFLLHKSDQYARIKLSAKFKKVLQTGFRYNNTNSEVWTLKCEVTLLVHGIDQLMRV